MQNKSSQFNNFRGKPGRNFGAPVSASDAATKGYVDSATPDIAASIHAATAKTTIVDADEVGIWDSVSEALNKITWANLKATLKNYLDTLYSPQDGWANAEETWTYASADSPTFTFTISGDKTGKYSAGMRLKLTQTTVKYFIVTAVAYSAPNTTVTVYGGTDYTLANAAISTNYYSVMKAPQGFPLNPLKWTVLLSNSTAYTQGTPATNTWYNVGSLSLTIPIGIWNISYQSGVRANINTSAGFVFNLSTLSTANNSESDGELTSVVLAYGQYATALKFREKTLAVTTKTAYYLNHRLYSGSTTVSIVVNETGYSGTTVIKAVCAYL